jgi:pyrroline-5-carboxylate reductase
MLKKELVKAEDLLAAGPREERGKELQERYGILPFTENDLAAKNAEVVVISVKPQRLDRALDSIKGTIQENALVISIVAGGPIQKIKEALGHENIVRAMPNTPARIGEGITVWTSSITVSDEERELARQMLTGLGDEIYVEEEEFLDKATALSGTGPAYVYLFMEAMVDAGVHLGFSRRIAEKLVIETIRGSVNYYDLHDEHRHLARLRNQVTSPGGTSAEAIYFLEKAGFRTAISRAVWAAYEKSVALGKGKSSAPSSE